MRDSAAEGDANAATSEAIREASLEIARAAETIRDVSVRASRTMMQGRLAQSIARSPRTGLPAVRAVVRAVTDPHGLAGPVGTLPSKFYALIGRESLAVLVAVSSLRLRIAAVAESHPELLDDPAIAGVVEAVSNDRQVEALRRLRRLIRDVGAQAGLGGIAPIFSELLALNLLLDENPFNDEVGWSIASGRSIRVEFMRLVGALARSDVGEGYAERTEIEPEDAAQIRADQGIVGFVRDLAILENGGRVLVLAVRADSDGETRYLLCVPGMEFGIPDRDSPQDLVGALRNTLMDDSPYTRSCAKALEDFGVPEGAELALIGHSEGGAVVMNLAQDRSFVTRFRLTHVVALGAPVDFKAPADPLTWVATVTNQHDLIPSLDGQGPGSPFHLHPEWYVVDYTDETHQFPQCHNAWRYLENLERDLPEARAELDARLADYAGELVQSQVYAVYDDAPARRHARRSRHDPFK